MSSLVSPVQFAIRKNGGPSETSRRGGLIYARAAESKQQLAVRAEMIAQGEREYEIQIRNAHFFQFRPTRRRFYSK